MQRALPRPALLVAAFLFVLLCTPTLAQVRTSMIDGQKVIEGEVLVKFREVSPNTLASLAKKYDLSVTQPLGRVPHLYRLHSRSPKVADLIAAFSTRSDVLYAEPNFQYQLVDLPNDPMFANQWALHNAGQSSSGFPAGTAGADISALLAWTISTGTTAHLVGVVDTGIDYTRPDLLANVWSGPTSFIITSNGVLLTCPACSHGFNTITGTCDPLDDHGHGTHVSGIIGAAGNNNLGVVGVNWTTQLIGLKFINAQGYGYTAGRTAPRSPSEHLTLHR